MLMRLFAGKIDGYEPRIVDLERPILIVGMEVETDLRRIYRDVPGLGRRYQEFKRRHTIPDKKTPWGFAAVTWGHDEATGAMTYMMGDMVNSLEAVPEGLRGFTIPAIKYAIFPIRPRNRCGWPFAIADVKRYAYTVWLPRSGYEPAGVIDDFEYHDERSTRPKQPEVDLYVAVRPRDRGSDA